jgi:signal transduction histidine kinase
MDITTFYEAHVNVLRDTLLIIALGISMYFVVGYTIRKLIIRQKILKLLIERRTREIQQKNEELEKNNIIKTRLISIISHDLISPLKYIHFTSRNLLDNKDKLDGDLLEEMMVEILNSSKELELISTNILNWIKYQNENRRLTKEEFDLHEVVDHIFSVFNGIARQKKIELVNECNTGTILYQYMEPIRIVLYNLILNALNFTEKGKITVSGGTSVKGILIKVKDEGVGMTPEQIDNILSDKFIVSSINVDKRKGNGLGYLIIKDLLKLVEAKFVIKSKKNKGTQVSILLPK